MSISKEMTKNECRDLVLRALQIGFLYNSKKLETRGLTVEVKLDKCWCKYKSDVAGISFLI